MFHVDIEFFVATTTKTTYCTVDCGFQTVLMPADA